ncbi:hypothetical protein HK097_002897 [Rhizophlyctis rosea]|uniref:Uncharacterized protein n=1 Tax=Rhizophlyctis rosea TaxID=64517 RepID=A0AAD5S5E1_9FUNG|nr:hypothetical protein HK097_002897 [Rhizophlyctis rosea]
MTKLADFIDLDEVMALLLDGIYAESFDSESIPQTLQVGMELTCARKLVGLVSEWVVANIEVLHEDGPVKEYF